MQNAKVVRADQCEVVTAPWGSLTWYANAHQGNSESLSVGRCVIHPGCENPRHSHPNCAEVLVVQEGAISHMIEGGRYVELRAGDTITVPPHLPHQARNVGKSDAVLLVVFSSPSRETRSE